MARDILIVDDEADIRELVAGILHDEGYDARVAGDSDTALAAVEQLKPSLLVLDIWLQGSRLDGLELLDVIRRSHPEMPVVIISGHGNVETAVSAIKKGAYDFIEKPFKADRLILIVKRAIEAAQLKRENEALRIKAGEDNELIGCSAAIAQVRQQIDKVAPTGSRVLITGPAGVGKELAARMVHAQSQRANHPFIVLNAAALSPERVEAELFGVEGRGDSLRETGLFEEAHGGTLYIDEIGDMPMETQSKILRALVEQTFQRIGGMAKVQVDVRVISSSAKNLDQLIGQGRFREDLYHRLNVIPIHIPPLAERREDIPFLIEHFIQLLAASMGLPRKPMGVDAIATLQAHDWPGNARQLRNNIERLLIMTTEAADGIITAEMLPSDISISAPSLTAGPSSERVMSLSLREARESFERDYLTAQINRFGGNISRTASFIGMERSALHRKLKSLGVSSSSRPVESRL